MANEVHLKILKQGMKAWNRWREENPETGPDLSEADLRQLDLIDERLRKRQIIDAYLSGGGLSEAHPIRLNLNGVNLREANLSGANLKRADIKDAKLNGADLRIAHLNGADLRRANLRQANLSGADLGDADLRGADLSEADFSEGNLAKANLKNANLSKAWLSEVNLKEADLSGADISEAKLIEAYLAGANFTGAILRGTDLRTADLTEANLSRADLRAADLSEAKLNKTNLTEATVTDANLTGAALIQANLQSATLANCKVYGVSAWELNLTGTVQSDLIITIGKPIITVDSLEVAQFIYLLLYNEKIRSAIDAITTKVVLILGRFTPERKAVLDTIRGELRKHDLLPVLFDFDKPATRDTQETVAILASLARFVIADITDPRSIPQELVSTVETLPSVPVQPILELGSEPWGMYDHIKRYPWVLAIHRYRDLDDLLASFEEKVIAPPEAKAKELTNR